MDLEEIVSVAGEGRSVYSCYNPSKNMNSLKKNYSVIH